LLSFGTGKKQIPKITIIEGRKGNMEQIKIKASQMCMLIILFEMGSALVLVPGTAAKQDAWIAVLIGLLCGLLLYFVYYRLFKYYPDLPLTSYVQEITGKFIGRILGFLYVVYFIYIATRVLRDFGELLTSTIYSYTPLFILNALMVLTVIYTTRKGFEVLSRVGEIYFGVVYLLAFAGITLVAFSGLIHLDNLLPMLENGWTPVMKTVAVQTLNRPFGEMVVFTMFLPFINEPKKAKIVGLAGMLLSGLNIAITTVINISVLGTDIFVRTPFPLLSTIGKIQIAEFLERLDVLFMLYLVIGVFFKITIFFYAAVAGTADLFGFKDQRRLCFPIGLLLLIGSVTIATSITEHFEEGIKFVPIYLQWPLQIIIPCLLLIIAFFRNRKRAST
jgi:spore germination protein KB